MILSPEQAWRSSPADLLYINQVLRASTLWAFFFTLAITW